MSSDLVLIAHVFLYFLESNFIIQCLIEGRLHLLIGLKETLRSLQSRVLFDPQLSYVGIMFQLILICKTSIIMDSFLLFLSDRISVSYFVC